MSSDFRSFDLVNESLYDKLLGCDLKLDLVWGGDLAVRKFASVISWSIY